MGRGCQALSLVALLISPVAGSDPSYDHQTTTYDADFAPVTTRGEVAFAPYFSPDHAMDTTVDLFNNATESIDIAIPSISSWLSDCGAYVDDDAATCAPGCSPEEQRGETFPIFPALLNALHRGVHIRLLTNDYNYPDCPGTITQLQFLELNGADVRYYTTTTYIHAKYQSIDNGRKTAVSSINWSKASMTKNREAGVVVDGARGAGAALTAYMQSVFEKDFAQAYALVPGKWTTAQLAVIQDTSELPVVIPPITLAEGMYITPPAIFGRNVLVSTTAQASPDSAWDTIESVLDAAQKSIEIAMYQITTDELCDQVLDMFNSGVNVSLLVSSRIYASGDCNSAKKCYAKLYAGGLRFRKSSDNYEYSHNKYWVVDGEAACWSTGNWSPTDYPPNHDNTYPMYGESDWADSNRDYTLYTDSPYVISSFTTLFQNDWWAPATAEWTPESDIVCGY